MQWFFKNGLHEMAFGAGLSFEFELLNMLLVAYSDSTPVSIDDLKVVIKGRSYDIITMEHSRCLS